MTMSVFSHTRFPLALMAAAALTACGGGDDTTTTTPTATTQSVSIDFAATIGSSVLNIGTCADTQVNGIATRSPTCASTSRT